MRALTVSAVLTLTLAGSIPAAGAVQRGATAEPRAASPKLDTPTPDELRFICFRQQKLGDFLARLDPGVPHTIRVVGACRENLVLSGFARLTLLAWPGASISDASGGTDYVVQTAKSATVELQGFRINGSVGCFEGSTCTFSADIFQNGFANGVEVIRSYADFLSETVIRNSAGRGLTVSNGSVVRADRLTIQNASGNGIVLVGGAHLTLFSSTIRNNRDSGITARVQSSIRIFDSTIRNNDANGVVVESGSVAQVLNDDPGTSIIDNGLVGVVVGDLSFVEFGDGTNITGNLSGLDVQCLPQFSATRGALANIGGGSTNCVEP